MLLDILHVARTVLIGLLVFLVVVAGLYSLQIGFVVHPFEWNRASPNHTQDQFSVMTANIGNSDLRCYPSKWKLCQLDVEQRLTENLQQVQPDMIALQEVFASYQCQDIQDPADWHVCSIAQDPPQARRLLGDEYSIVCEPNSQFECIAVHRDAGEIVGCPVGGYCDNARTPVPLPGCDAGFSISAVTVRLVNGAVFDVVNIHPASFSESCRADLLQRALLGDETSPSIIQEEKVLIMGDFNMDPWRGQDRSTEVWTNFFEQGWAGMPLAYHSGIAEKDPPYYTLHFFVKRTLDLVVSNFAEGVCQVWGETPGTARLDGGVGNDHRALYGILTFKP